MLEKTINEKEFVDVAKLVLSDIDWGFFILAECDNKPVGMMYFTYEWSDWRNGVFFWLQSAYAVNTGGVNEDQIYKSMLELLELF